MKDIGSRVFSLLTRTAMEDGRMTREETMIVSKAMKTAQEFGRHLDKALEDGVITEEERSQLHELRTRIFTDAADIAEEDQVITADEVSLLNRILEELVYLRDLYDTTGFQQ